MSPLLIDRLLTGAWETFVMIGVSSLITLLLGIPLALILVATARDGIFAARLFASTTRALTNGYSTGIAPPRQAEAAIRTRREAHNNCFPRPVRGARLGTSECGEKRREGTTCRSTPASCEARFSSATVATWAGRF